MTKSNGNMKYRMENYKKKVKTVMVRNEVLVWYRHKNMAGLNRLMGSQPLKFVFQSIN
jgi:hypothetical protein